jgi:sec-independent protein translocase protein TatA
VSNAFYIMHRRRAVAGNALGLASPWLRHNRGAGTVWSDYPLPSVTMSFLGLGTPELLLILLVLLLFFGKDKLPELARSIGKSVRELKAGFEKSTEDVTVANATKEGEKAATAERKKS